LFFGLPRREASLHAKPGRLERIAEVKTPAPVLLKLYTFRIVCGCRFYSPLVRRSPANARRRWISCEAGGNTGGRIAPAPFVFIYFPRYGVCIVALIIALALPSCKNPLIIQQGAKNMAVKLFDAKGTPLGKQMFTWKELVQRPISKLDDDAFTRVRIILMNGIEQQANRFQHACAQMNGEPRYVASNTTSKRW
jgi:hypothetical protein